MLYIYTIVLYRKNKKTQYILFVVISFYTYSYFLPIIYTYKYDIVLDISLYIYIWE